LGDSGSGCIAIAIAIAIVIGVVTGGKEIRNYKQ
jgi:hypothetical protein